MMKNIWLAAGCFLIVVIVGFAFITAKGNGDPNKITPGNGYYTDVRWSPDGKKISYIKDNELEVLDLKTGKTTTIVGKDDLASRADWFDDKTLFVVLKDNDLSKTLDSLRAKISKVNINTKHQTFLENGFTSASTISVNRSIVYLGHDKEGVSNFNLLKPEEKPSRIDIGMVQGTYFQLSPKGDRIAFLDLKTIDKNSKPGPLGSFTLYIYDLRTKQTKRIEHLKDYEVSRFTWSPDGSQVAFIGKPSGSQKSSVFIGNVDKPEEPKMIYPNNLGDIDWSPTENLLVANTVGQPGKNDIVLIPFQK